MPFQSKAQKAQADDRDQAPPEPGRPDFTSETDTHYIVLHTGVGSFREGDVIASGDLGSGIDIDRLLNLEAIAPATSDEGLRVAAIKRANASGLPITASAAQYAGIPYAEANLIERQAGAQAPAPEPPRAMFEKEYPPEERT